MPVELNYATPVKPIEPRWLRASCLMAGASSLALAINVRDGEYWPSALLLVTVALPFVATGALFPRARDRGFGVAVVTAVTIAAVAVQMFAYHFSPPGGRNPWSDDLTRRSVPGLALYYAAAVVALLLWAAGATWPRMRGACVAVLLMVHLTVGSWFIRASPSPRIDVHVFQQQAAQALLDGRNPYAIGFADIYNSDDPGQRAVYGPELVRGGKLAFGFPYPPVSLLLSTAAYALAGDHRYAQLAAVAAAGAFLAFTTPNWAATLAAILFLFAPRAFFVLGRGWTEPFVVLFLAASVFCAWRCRKLLPVALGLLLASKQYTLLIVPLVPLLIDGPFSWRKYVSLLARAACVAAAVTLPFAVWDPSSFWHSLVTVQKVAPFREDALSYLVWLYHKTGVRLGVLPAFFAAGLAIVAALWRAERSPAGFAAAVALVYLVFIALNKQAFANYYYFVIGALWCAVAAIHTTDAERAAAAGSTEAPRAVLEVEAPNVR